VRFKNLPWGSNQKNLPWGSKTYRGAATKKTYREVQKLTVGQQQPKKLTVRFKNLSWGRNQKNLPWGSKTYRGAQPKKLTVRFKNLPWGSKTYRGAGIKKSYREVQKVTKNLSWGNPKKLTVRQHQKKVIVGIRKNSPLYLIYTNFFHWILYLKIIKK